MKSGSKVASICKLNQVAGLKLDGNTMRVKAKRGTLCRRDQSEVQSGLISAKTLTMFSINPSFETDTLF